MKIEKSEALHLAELYERANASDSKTDWNFITSYYKKLGKKYNFDVTKVSISLQGKVNELKYCFKCNGLATGIDGTEYVRAKHPNTKKWNKYPICPQCIAKHYPEIHKMDDF